MKATSPRSDLVPSARVLAAVQDERFHLIWNQSARSETEMILRRIRRLDWEEVVISSSRKGSLPAPSILAPSAFVLVRDRDDQKFAALSAAAKGLWSPTTIIC
jgi:hypothetical protein